jgi:hypothetical protein
MNYPVAIPDLIGVRNRRYLDRTGLVQHRGIGDLMRYAALNNEMDFLSKFGDFIPRGEDYRNLPAPSPQLVACISPEASQDPASGQLACENDYLPPIRAGSNAV